MGIRRRQCDADCVAEVVNGVPSLQPLLGWNASLAHIPEASGDLIDPPASNVEGKCGGNSNSGLSSGPNETNLSVSPQYEDLISTG